MGTLTGRTPPGQREHGNNNNEGVLKDSEVEPNQQMV